MSNQLPNRPIIPKHSHHRSRALLNSAKYEACTMRSPWCNGDKATVVCAHSNLSEDGKGMRIKADDDITVYACSECHRYYDTCKGDSQAVRQAYFDRAFVRTYRRRKELGIIKL